MTYLYSEGEEYELVPWRAVLRRNGDQFARRDAAEDWIARFEERVTDLRELLADRWAGATYALAYPEPEMLYLCGRDGGHIPDTLSELGLQPAGSVGRLLADAGPFAQGGAGVSYERLGALDDADVLFVTVSAGPDGAPDRSGIEALAAQPLWSRLPAVRDQQVHEFVGDIFFESGPMAMAFLDVVERSLLS